MKKIQSIYKQFFIEEKHTPLLFLLIAIIAFGLQANRLGYYQDDWPYVFYAFNKGISSLKEALFFDSRPNAAWLYIILFSIIGFKPFAWQIAALLFRWLTATVFWYFFKSIWPSYLRYVTFAIAIFVIHPFFIIQPEAVNSMLYWVGYLMFALSLLIMAYNYRSEKYSVPLTVLAVFLEGMHLFTSEYFVGVTLIRPVILYWLISNQTQSVKKTLLKVIVQWAPYTFALGLYILWRLFLFTPPPGGDRNTPRILIDIITHPATALPGFLQIALQDFTIVVITSWYKAFQSNFFTFSTPFSIANLFLFLLTTVITYFFFSKIKFGSDEAVTQKWLKKLLVLGLLIVFLGLMPIWFIGQDISTHINQYAASRFGIVATLGASLFLTALLIGFIRDHKRAALAIAILVGLGTQMQIKNGDDFAYSSAKQENLFRQILWRAPEIASGTAIVTDEEVLGFMGHYAFSFGVMTSYQVGNITKPLYWYFPFYYTDPNASDFLAGIPLEAGRLSMNFKGNSRQYLLFAFNPEEKRCLWVLQPQDQDLLLVSQDMRELSAGSNINLIKDNHLNKTLPEKIFGAQTTTNHWCYFFQKADLARQYQKWDEITHLMDQAKAAGVHGENGFEFIPFIEGYGHVNKWDEVKFLVKSATKITSGLGPSLCSTLDRLVAATDQTSDRDEIILELRTSLSCQAK